MELNNIQKLINTELDKSDIKELREAIRFLDKKYYIGNESVVSDMEYDLLFKKLKELEDKFPELITEDSPTQRIAKNIQQGFSTKKHLVPMLSLDNTYNEEDLRQFDERVRKALNNLKYSYILEVKFDGISVSLTYKQGLLTTAITRGNGLEGEDITQNIRTISSIPLKIDTENIDVLEIRGEILMPKKVFEDINSNLEEKGLQPYANTRNAASGSVRQLDPNITQSRHLDAYFYQVIIPGGNKFMTYSESISYISNLGFKISPYTKELNTIQEVIDECVSGKDKKNKYPFDIDGLVIKVNNIEQQKLLGYTSHHPKWAIAYKFPAERVETKIQNIQIQVGRTGVLTPVAILEPVKLSGVTIQKATLHNQDEINKKDIRIGDTVNIERAGEVIPSVIEVVLDKREANSEKFSIPLECPSCSSKAERLPGEVAIRCLNLNCPAQLKRKIQHFCSRAAMDIEGLGDRLIETFVENKVFQKISDIYRLKEHSLQISTESGFGAKSITNLLTSIEKSKQNELWRLIHGLGIKYVGKTASKVIAENIQCILDLKDMDVNRLLELDDIGEKTAITIKDYFNNESNIELIEELEDLGVNVNKTIKNIGKFRDLQIAMTGSMDLISRKDLQNKIEENGGTVSSTISKKTNYLIAGDSSGSKLNKAQELSIEILTEKEFIEKFGIELEKDAIEIINQNSLF